MSDIEGVLVEDLKRYADSRGWLAELFRNDQLPAGFIPQMAYLSVTHPGVSRGPHEHRHQTDGFAFLDGKYLLYLWENRPGFPARKEVHEVGSERPVVVYVPPGVVHAYRNVGEADAFVVNFPDRLYAGQGKREPVDEIRHEDDPEARFRIE